MKTLSLFIISLFLFNQAQANQQEQAQNLLNAVKSHCEMPAKMAPYTQANFDRYVLQIIYPDFKMLSTAFLQGFSTFESANLKRGYCVIAFLGLPNNPDWEKGFSFYNKAKAYGNLPQAMFAGFTEENEVLLKPMTETN